MDLKRFIRNIPDFPNPEIMFRDVSTLLQNPAARRQVIKDFVAAWEGHVDVIVGLESRGFIFGSILADRLDLPFVMIRKKGKLPGEVISQAYGLEYGSDIFEIQVDAFAPGARVLIVDDLLATGGSAAAAAALIKKARGTVAGCAFVIELRELNGAANLPGLSIQTLAVYKKEDALTAA